MFNLFGNRDRNGNEAPSKETGLAGIPRFFLVTDFKYKSFSKDCFCNEVQINLVFVLNSSVIIYFHIFTIFIYFSDSYLW